MELVLPSAWRAFGARRSHPGCPLRAHNGGMCRSAPFEGEFGAGRSARNGLGRCRQVVAAEVDRQPFAVFDDRAHADWRGEVDDVNLAAVAIGESIALPNLDDRARPVAVRWVGPVHPPFAGGVIAGVMEHERALTGRGVQSGIEHRAGLLDGFGNARHVPDGERGRRESRRRFGAASRDPRRHPPRRSEDQQHHTEPAEHGEHRSTERRSRFRDPRKP